MKAQEFINELSKVHSLFDWKAVPDNEWTPDRRTKPRLHIRATSKDLVGGVVFEPIGALCYIQTGQAFGAEYWADAARAINLSDEDAWMIMAAVNDLTWRFVGEHRAPHHKIRTIRGELIAALGLEKQIPDPEPGFVWL